MDIRFVTKKLHAYLDYPVALTLLTDHSLGVIRILPYGFHLAVDGLVGTTFLAAPALLGFSGPDAWFYWINGAAVACVVSLHKPEPRPVTAFQRN